MNTQRPASPRGRTGRRARPWLVALCTIPWLAVAAVLWTLAWPMQLERACWRAEWPFENGCPQFPAAGAPNQPAAVLAQHVQRNPGDARAWALLAGRWWQDGDHDRVDALWPALRELAPHDDYVLALRYERALAQHDWPQAAQALVVLLGHGQRDAAPALLQLMTTPATRDGVLAQVDADADWVQPFLRRLDREVPLRALLPVVRAAIDQDLLDVPTQLLLIDRLRREGDVQDAYTLWVALRGAVPAGLYNGGFDAPALRRGFDWSWPLQPAQRRGFFVEQIAAAPRPGLMLELTLTGRAALPTPMVTQDLLLPGRRYELTGRYRVDKLRAEEGLVWTLRCTSGGERFATVALDLDTERQWQEFALSFAPPRRCGGAVSLRLETAAPWEARAGMVGVVYFDDFALTRIAHD